MFMDIYYRIVLLYFKNIFKGEQYLKIIIKNKVTRITFKGNVIILKKSTKVFN